MRYTDDEIELLISDSEKELEVFERNSARNSRKMLNIVVDLYKERVSANDDKFYKTLSTLMPKVEGEFIQDLYFYFKSIKLDEEMCDTFKGELIPTLEDLEAIQEGVSNMLLIRHEQLEKGNLYD